MFDSDSVCALILFFLLSTENVICRIEWRHARSNSHKEFIYSVKEMLEKHMNTGDPLLNDFHDMRFFTFILSLTDASAASIS